MTVNKVILVGNLGADPETRQTQSGSTVGNLRLATTERRKDRDGNWTDHTEWHRVTVFGKTAENVDRFCKKGKQVYVEGRLQTRKWQDKDGQDRWSTEVVADTVRFLGSKSDASSTTSSGYGGGSSGRSGGGYGGGGASGQGYGGGSADDSIPF